MASNNNGQQVCTHLSSAAELAPGLWVQFPHIYDIARITYKLILSFNDLISRSIS